MLWLTSIRPKPLKLLTVLGLLFALALATGLFAGCGPDPCPPTDPKCKPPKPIEGYPKRVSPTKAVAYLRMAWEKRDSTAADSVLADDYQGTSTDVGTTTTTIGFLKSDEIRALHGLKDDPNITDLSMTFGPENSWVPNQYPGDPPDWVVIVVNDPDILVRRTTGGDLSVSHALTSFEFKTKPVVEGSETLWQVVRWKEVHNAP